MKVLLLITICLLAAAEAKPPPSGNSLEGDTENDEIAIESPNENAEFCAAVKKLVGRLQKIIRLQKEEEEETFPTDTEKRLYQRALENEVQVIKRKLDLKDIKERCGNSIESGSSENKAKGPKEGPKHKDSGSRESGNSGESGNAENKSKGPKNSGFQKSGSSEQKEAHDDEETDRCKIIRDVLKRRTLSGPQKRVLLRRGLKEEVEKCDKKLEKNIEHAKEKLEDEAEELDEPEELEEAKEKVADEEDEEEDKEESKPVVEGHKNEETDRCKIIEAVLKRRTLSGRQKRIPLSKRMLEDVKNCAEKLADENAQEEDTLEEKLQEKEKTKETLLEKEEKLADEIKHAEETLTEKLQTKPEETLLEKEEKLADDIEQAEEALKEKLQKKPEEEEEEEEKEEEEEELAELEKLKEAKEKEAEEGDQEELKPVVEEMIDKNEGGTRAQICRDVEEQLQEARRSFRRRALDVEGKDLEKNVAAIEELQKDVKLCKDIEQGQHRLKQDDPIIVKPFPMKQTSSEFHDEGDDKAVDANEGSPEKELIKQMCDQEKVEERKRWIFRRAMQGEDVKEEMEELNKGLEICTEAERGSDESPNDDEEEPREPKEEEKPLVNPPVIKKPAPSHLLGGKFPLKDNQDIEEPGENEDSPEKELIKDMCADVKKKVEERKRSLIRRAQEGEDVKEEEEEEVPDKLEKGLKICEEAGLVNEGNPKDEEKKMPLIGLPNPNAQPELQIEPIKEENENTNTQQEPKDKEDTTDSIEDLFKEKEGKEPALSKEEEKCIDDAMFRVFGPPGKRSSHIARAQAYRLKRRLLRSRKEISSTSSEEMTEDEMFKVLPYDEIEKCLGLKEIEDESNAEIEQQSDKGEQQSAPKPKDKFDSIEKLFEGKDGEEPSLSAEEEKCIDDAVEAMQNEGASTTDRKRSYHLARAHANRLKRSLFRSRKELPSTGTDEITTPVLPWSVFEKCLGLEKIAEEGENNEMNNADDENESEAEDGENKDVDNTNQGNEDETEGNAETVQQSENGEQKQQDLANPPIEGGNDNPNTQQEPKDKVDLVKEKREKESVLTKEEKKCIDDAEARVFGPKEKRSSHTARLKAYVVKGSLLRSRKGNPSSSSEELTFDEKLELYPYEEVAKCLEKRKRDEHSDEEEQQPASKPKQRRWLI